jgi:hypothetical protein
VLKLDHSALVCFHISNVFRAVLRSMNDFLPSDRKFVLPGAMPYGFVLPPMVTVRNSMMGPMPHSVFSTLRYHNRATTWAFAQKTRFSLTAASFDKRKFHDETPNAADAPSLAISVLGICEVCRWGGWIAA